MTETEVTVDHLTRKAEALRRFSRFIMLAKSHRFPILLVAEVAGEHEEILVPGRLSVDAQLLDYMGNWAAGYAMMCEEWAIMHAAGPESGLPDSAGQKTWVGPDGEIGPHLAPEGF